VAQRDSWTIVIRQLVVNNMAYLPGYRRRANIIGSESQAGFSRPTGGGMSGDQNQDDDPKDGGPSAFEEQSSQSFVGASSIDRITFSNLEAMIPPVQRREAPEPEDEERTPSVNGLEDMSPASSKGSFGLILGGVLICAVGIAGWMIWGGETTPRSAPSPAAGASTGTSSGAGAKGQAPSKPAAATTNQAMTGAVVLSDMTVKSKGSDSRKRERSLEVRGRVLNGTNRIQRDIDFEISIVDGDVAVHRSRHTCCAADPSGKKGSGAGVARLEPGQSAPFTFEVKDLKGKVAGLKLQGRILFAEAELPSK
jgi:hypothetical protein